MLTGRVPFLGATAVETLRQVEEKEPVPPRLLNPAVPADLETICLKCLEKDSRKRYGDASALAADLRRFLNGEPILARPVGPWEKALKWARRRPAVAALIGVSALAVLGFIAGGVWYNVRLRAEAERAHHAETEARKRQAEAETARKEADHNLAYAELAQAGMYLDARRFRRTARLWSPAAGTARSGFGRSTPAVASARSRGTKATSRAWRSLPTGAGCSREVATT